MGEEISCVEVSDPDPNGPRQLVLRGTVNVGGAHALRDAALQLGGADRDVVVRCDQAEHLDLSAWQILLALRERLQARGRRLTLAGVGAPVGRYLRLTGLDGAFADV